MATMSFRTALLLILIGFSDGADLLITPDECKLVIGLIVGDRCFVEYSTIQPGNASEPGADLLITSHECELVIGQKVDGRCSINPLTLYQTDRCPHLYLNTASGCIGPISGASCTFRNGLEVDDLCVIIKKAPEVEAKPEPQVPQYKFEDAVIIPNATYQKDTNNGFKPLTKSENYYVQSVCGQTTAPQARIVNGQVASKGQFPWVVDFGCTGTLISPRHVLTAAHCFYDTESDAFGACYPKSEKDVVNATIHYGGVCRNFEDEDCNGSDTKTATINRVIYGHDNPSKCIDQNDIAIVLLNKDIEFDDYVKPICLGKIHFRNLTNAKSVGYGMTDYKVTGLIDTSILRYFNSKIISIDQTHLEIDTHSPEASACYGDSGGPVQASFNGSSRTYSAGIHSRVTNCKPGSTLTSTYVPAFVDWVCQQTGVCELD